MPKTMQATIKNNTPAAYEIPQLPSADVPHLDQYFGVWAMEPDRFSATIQGVSRMDLAAHIAQQIPLQAKSGDGSGSGDYTMTGDGIAVIEIIGTLTKYGSSMSSEGSTQLARRRVRAAVRDSAVKAIAIMIDSPGGSVSGTKDLADEIARAGKTKVVGAYIEDLGASAAYWIASQAGFVAANESALVGSIGTYGVIYDMSKRAENEGIKVHVVRAGEFKGAGAPGTEVTDAQLAEYQRTVNSLNAFFVKAVGDGRAMEPERVAAIADGRIHVASEAKAIGLIDAIITQDEFFLRLAGNGTSTSAIKSQGGIAMSETQETPKAATFHEIKAACRGADEKFICAQLENGATAEQARDAWTDELNARLKASEEAKAEAEKNAADAKAEAEKKPAQASGVDPLGSGKAKADAGGADATERWNSAVSEKVKAGMARKDAIRAVAVEDPDLHAEYLDEVNQSKNKLDR